MIRPLPDGFGAYVPAGSSTGGPSSLASGHAAGDVVLLGAVAVVLGAVAVAVTARRRRRQDDAVNPAPAIVIPTPASPWDGKRIGFEAAVAPFATVTHYFTADRADAGDPPTVALARPGHHPGRRHP